MEISWEILNQKLIGLEGNIESGNRYQTLVGGFNHLEKYQSMGRIIPYILENKKCLKPPTRTIVKAQWLFQSSVLPMTWGATVCPLWPLALAYRSSKCVFSNLEECYPKIEQSKPTRKSCQTKLSPQCCSMLIQRPADGNKEVQWFTSIKWYVYIYIYTPRILTDVYI